MYTLTRIFSCDMTIIDQDTIKELKEYDNHIHVYSLDNPDAGLRGFIAIHRKNKTIPSFGATRLWRYENPLDGLSDALRLSRMMSYKAALAGLPCGGAKSVILAPERLSDKKRRELLLAYVAEVNKLRGEFITGSDVGVSEDDLKLMKNASEFFVGVKGDATENTAIGIHAAIKTCLEFIGDSGDLSDKTIAIQGLGKIGKALLGLVYNEAKQIFAADINQTVIENVRQKYPRISIVAPSELHKQSVDIFSPCALSHSLTAEVVAELKCRIIAGGANSQLENESVGDKLFQLGILYAPDYVVNAGGLISVYDEYEHPDVYGQAWVHKKVLAIKNTLRRIIYEGKERGIPTNRIANETAEKIFNGY